MINVTKTFLPPIEEYNNHLKKIWETSWLTNRGPLIQQLEDNVKKYLNINNILITNNGTLPIQLAIKLLGKGGEIITTPFSYVATTSAIVWEHCTPVFVDIHPEYLTIDETKIEAAITENTTCILATHVFGNPCNIEAIEKIAVKHNLKVIYDAAHCFGVTYKGKSIFEYGDISTCSFHATKIFHTGEGGAIFSSDQSLLREIFYLHNFGHKTPLEFHGIGINGKISELQAAMGLAVLPYIDDIIKSRQSSINYYMKNLNSKRIYFLKLMKDTKWNFSYFPVIFESENDLLKIEKALNSFDIFPRRYFYPSLNTLPYVRSEKMEVSESISSRILCLPLFYSMPIGVLEKICEIINKNE